MGSHKSSSRMFKMFANKDPNIPKPFCWCFVDVFLIYRPISPLGPSRRFEVVLHLSLWFSRFGEAWAIATAATFCGGLSITKWRCELWNESIWIFQTERSFVFLLTVIFSFAKRTWNHLELWKCHKLWIPIYSRKTIPNANSREFCRMPQDEAPNSCAPGAEQMDYRWKTQA